MPFVFGGVVPLIIVLRKGCHFFCGVVPLIIVLREGCNLFLVMWYH